MPLMIAIIAMHTHYLLIVLCVISETNVMEGGLEITHGGDDGKIWSIASALTAADAAVGVAARRPLAAAQQGQWWSRVVGDLHAAAAAAEPAGGRRGVLSFVALGFRSTRE